MKVVGAVAMKTHRTNFEQIPVAVVKSLVKEIQVDGGEQDVVLERAAAKSEPYATATTAQGRAISARSQARNKKEQRGS